MILKQSRSRQPNYLVFPAPGCWEITGRVADASLTFVALVEKIREGFPWKFVDLKTDGEYPSEQIMLSSSRTMRCSRRAKTHAAERRC
jgi:hypothetical protein